MECDILVVIFCNVITRISIFIKERKTQIDPPEMFCTVVRVLKRYHAVLSQSMKRHLKNTVGINKPFIKADLAVNTVLVMHI